MPLLAAKEHAPPQPLDHVVDVIFLRIGETPVLTLHMVTLVVAVGILLWVFSRVRDGIAVGPASEGHRRYLAKGRLAQLFEVIILYLRNEMIVPILGEQTARKHLPFLLSLFFFIWFNNLLGMVPLLSFQHLIGGLGWGNYHFALVGGTATGNIAVTAALALIAFVVIQIHGIRDLGIGGYLHHLLGGAPWWLAPLMVPVEIIGTIIKPAALAIRLFANMLAGHTLLATVLLFTYMALQAGLGWFMGLGVIGAVSGVAGVAIFMLELFVATLQAFVFMFLTTVFIGLLTHHDDHEHGHEHGDQHGDQLGSQLGSQLGHGEPVPAH